jgi:hypothetical protein
MLSSIEGLKISLTIRTLFREVNLDGALAKLLKT